MTLDWMEMMDQLGTWYVVAYFSLLLLLCFNFSLFSEKEWHFLFAFCRDLMEDQVSQDPKD